MSARGRPRTALVGRDRALALASVALPVGTSLWLLHRVLDVVGGDVGLFALEVFGAVALAAALSRVLRARHALVLSAAGLLAGLGWYLATVPGALRALGDPLVDTAVLLTGLSVLRVTNAGVWVLAITPAPVFLAWYLAFRRRYAVAALAGGATVTLFLLTGDASLLAGLAGAAGAVGAVGFGALDREGGTPSQRRALVTVLVAMLVVATSISLVPGGQAQPLLPDADRPTLQGSLVETDDRVGVLGRIQLSPRVLFTVTAERPAYWRVGAYDRYTGDGWVRTGPTRPYAGTLDRPPGGGERFRQSFRAEAAVDVMPAAWRPVRLDAGGGRAVVTDLGGLRPAEPLAPGDRYTVESVRPDPSPDALRTAGKNYPAGIADRYRQVPASTPDRVARFTANLTAGADSPYGTARVIEGWLERNKGYSLDVSKPEGDVAAAFLFRMDRGYCTYFATAMVTMLRTQGIPARFVVGYTPGQPVAGGRYVVRGFDSHAWVEMHVPGTGWLAFDPTPAGPRRDAEGTRLQQARAAAESGVDTALSRNRSMRRPPVGRTANGSTATNGSGAANGSARATNASGGRGRGAGGGLAGPLQRLPPARTLLYGAILAAGGVVAVRRSGLDSRAYRAWWLRRVPGGSPEERIAAAYDRLEYLLERRHRPRRADETPREYVEAVGADDRVRRLCAIYEAARYADHATAADAATARRLLAELRAGRSWG